MVQSRHNAASHMSDAPGSGKNPLDVTDEEFEAKVRESLRHYRETGLHLTQDEVEEWMRQRATGKRVPMPRLHT